ncbi:Epimerase family protein YfcH [Pseudodesulfovibrio profundus]|uniref:Epimerase family protein YfcH n=1 Tax=Pseudodesulfovibrio profundus TaxID=57320 RepID=A0A2C8F7J1_9BACT|nr:TIGR01777 family oxidoreductase [Pseudodesulfovibrio profundus]MBC17335.1 TIGR01777 family protein [Desulfovibrio sp.]SOB58606.1 Epimerase family protein YfcH [Pseudodesulfovibrio profundus]|tara:strand:+ start:33187 stop:34089 length:903 start_codon:yes stop_codon:yes gene_type:complete
MRAIIAGGTGFIGKNLVDNLKGSDWEIVVLSRSPGKVADIFDSGVIGMRWDNGDWPDMLGPETVVVNLAGENIADGRWTASKKERILTSRIKAGQRLVEVVKQSGVTPAALIQASAVGYYGPHGDKLIDESTPSGSGFLAEVCRQWEASTQELKSMGVRRCVIRTGMVLGDGGALEKMLPPFRNYLGGPPGDGFQGASWIHMADEVGAIRFLMENTAASGAFNLTAPTPVRMRKFSRILGETLDRPYKLKVPPFALRLLFGEMADEVLLSGQLALPKRLQEAGYEFRFATLEDALKDILG